MKPGDTISRYRIVAQIGKGGMGVVYRAEDTRLRRPVALKFLPDSLDEGRKYRFLNEARAAAMARHPNICPIHDIEEADGEIFIVMALLEGETLSRRIARGPLPPVEAAAIAAQIAAGLACAHDLGIVHRDIKSSNIMLDATGHVSIMDFGLALAPEAMRLTGEGGSVGTPEYMSPEQAEGKVVDRRTDLWSLGVVLFEMLTGGMPFRREHRSALVHAVLHDPVPEMPGVPQDLRAVVGKALAKDPADRWPSAHSMLRALKGEPEAASVEETPTRTIVSAVPPPRRRWPAAAALVVLLALAGLGYYWFRVRESGLPEAKHIAMMPAGADDASAAENGLEDALTAALSTQQNVTVVSSSELRRGGIKTAEAARKYHGVNLALTWSAKPSGDRVEFTIQLLNVVRGRVIDQRNLVYDPGNALVSRDQAVSQVFRMLNLGALPVAAKAPDPEAPEAFSSYLEGRGYLARYDLLPNIDKAIASFEKAIARDSRYALAYVGLAEAYWRKARSLKERRWMTLAGQNAEHAVALDPNLAAAHAILASVYRDSDDQPNAIKEFERALKLTPANAEAARELAQLYSSLGRYDEAEGLYVRSRDARPTDWNGNFLLGLFYARRERYDQAIDALNQAKQLAADNDLILYNLGRIYRACGRYDEAVRELQQALKVRTNDLFYAALGAVLYSQHKFAEAVAALDTAVELSPGTYWYWGNLGVYAKRAPGGSGKSTAALQHALELGAKEIQAEPENYSLRANLAEYRARLGDVKGALLELERIPEGARAPLTLRLALVYELAGQRDKAVALVRQNVKSPATLNQFKDDPDLAPVWQTAR